MNELVRTILHTLLDQVEQPERERVVRVRLNQKQHPSYFSGQDAAPRHAANRELRQLADVGIVRLHWQRWEENNWLEAVDLVADRTDESYALLRRTPRTVQHATLEQMLDQQRPVASWHQSFLDWARSQLSGGRSLAPLRRDDVEWNADFLRALQALAALGAPTLERSFSVRVFGDSKRFAVLESAVLRVLRQHDPAAVAYGEDSAALLRAHFLDRVPEYVPLAGPLRILSTGAALDLAPFQPSLALSAATIRAADGLECAADRLITVENSTSFSELSLRRPSSIAIIYTGGFASPTVIQLMRQLRRARPDLPIQHWGDLDAGGLRILAHLRREIGGVEVWKMDIATFESARRHAQPLSAGDRKALEQLRTQTELSDCVSLIDHLLATGLKLEQEAVRI
jgi:hypothetical protein